MRTLIFYFRILLAGLWFLALCFVGLLFCVFRWKDPSLGHVFARALGAVAQPLLGFRVRVEGAERIYAHQPCIYVANHQSNFDIFTYSSMYPSCTVVIGKDELKWIPLFGIFFVASGMIMIKRKDRVHSRAGLEQAKKAMKEQGVSVWLFPEGTRNRGAGQMLPFKKGAFHLALSAQLPIVPIVHTPLRHYVDRKEHMLGKKEIVIRVLEPVPTKGMTPDKLPRLIDEVRGRMDANLKELALGSRFD